MASEKSYYLSKDGKTFGPYTDAEYIKIKNSDDYKSYNWVWDSESPGWSYVSPPPPPPLAVIKEQRREGKRENDIQSICHNNQVIMSGWIISTSESDFLFVCEKSRDALPTFGKGNVVTLNLLHEPSGRSENTTASVIEAHRDNGRWEYSMKWNRVPALISLNLAK